MSKKFLAVMVFVLGLSACGQKEESASNSAPKEPSIPSLDVGALVKLNKNERNEIERRCLGSSHATCVALKSDSFKKSKALDKSFCEGAAIQKGFTNPAAGREQERLCEDR